jgi:hypothetical protein
VGEAPTAESRGRSTGRRRHESRRGEDPARGKEGVRVAAAWAGGLPNDGPINPEQKTKWGFGPG